MNIFKSVFGNSGLEYFYDVQKFARPLLERKIRHHRSLPAQGIIFPMGGDFKEVLKSRAKVCFPTHEKS